MMGERIANPKALGFAAFGIAAWMYGLLNAGWYSMDAAAATVGRFTALAAIALFIAALASFLRNESWYAVFFMFWTAVIWGQRAGGEGGPAPMAPGMPSRSRW